MVCSRLLTGLFLFSVFGFSCETQKLKNLPRIIKFLQNKYAEGDQFAVAINVPASVCTTDTKVNQKLLELDSPSKVKHSMNSSARVHKGQRLIAAIPKPFNQTSAYPAEYLLLIQSNPKRNTSYHPLLRNLLKKDSHGCMVFYTYRSPCVNTCSTPEGPYSILPALKLLGKHKGPKAFVFTHVQEHEVPVSGKVKPRPLAWCFRQGPSMYATMAVWENYESQLQWEANVNAIMARVPLYRCSGAKCTPCMYEHEVDVRCMYNDS